jgi:intracellular sulfur oxidation DsrE/DsrF family protein
MLLRAFFFVLGVMILSPVVHSAEIHDARAIGGLKEGKGVFLVDIGEAKKLAFYLKVIRGTYQNMTEQNVTPNFILVYIGPSVQYLTTKPAEDLEFEYSTELESIAESVKELNKLGIRQEVCAVATNVFNVDNATVLPGMSLVRDGFISLIGYQAQGYHLVPVF